MRHTMKLKEDPFERMKNGTKTIEFRLYDEKRREIHMIKTYAHEWIKEVLKNENLDKPIKESFIFKDKMIRKINIGGSKNEAHNEIKRGSI